MQNICAKKSIGNILWSQKKSSVWIFVLQVFCGSILLALASQVFIPWQPVPFTLQSAAVVFMGLSMGRARATAAVVLYIFEGMVGFPVFAEAHFGLATLMGPAGGYILGFVPAAFLAGFLMERGFARYYLTALIAALVSALIIFAVGYIQLSAFVGLLQAYVLGVKPFLLTESAKLILLTIGARYFWKMRDETHG